MQIAGKDLRRMIKQIGIIRIGLLKLVPCQRLVQVTKVVGQQRLAIFDQADRRFQMRAIGHHLRNILKPLGQRQRARHPPPRTAQHHEALRRQTFDTVIQPPHDLSVMHQERIGKPAQFLARLGVANHLWFTREVAGCHHQGAIHRIYQQVMQRRVGQHPAIGCLTRSDTFGQLLRTFGNQNDWGGGILQQRRLLRGWRCEPVNVVQCAHQRERLAGGVFAPSQKGNRGGVGGVTGQVEPAEALDRNNLSGQQTCGCHGNRVTGLRLAICLKPQLWTARSTGHRLGMKPAVRRVAILAGAISAHIKSRHRGLRAVIRQGPQDRQARPTMGAVGEGITGTARIVAPDIGGAVRARGGIRCDPCFGPLRARGGNFEPAGDVFKLTGFTSHSIDAGQRRGLRRNGRLKRIQPGAHHMDQNPFGIVPHIALQARIVRQLPDKRTKSDALYLASHPDATARAQCTVQTMQGSKLRTIC